MRWQRFVLVCVVVVMMLLPPVRAGPTDDSGGVGPSPGPGGIGSGRNPGPGTSSLDGPGDGWDGDGDGGPTPPSLPPLSNVTATPALPNLVVSRFRSDRDSVRVGFPVEFTATVSNAGHLYAPGALLTLYDGVVDPAHAIGSANVDLRDFEAASTLTWVPAEIGVHTIVAFADADDAVEEDNETDNTASVVVSVLNGNVPGVPDLTSNEGDVGLESAPGTGVPTPVKVRVRNVGEVAAMSVGVDVTDNGVVVDSYTVPSIGAGSGHVRTLSWTPPTDGPHFLNVTVDGADAIRELDEDNNVASVGVGVDPASPPTCFRNGQVVYQPVMKGEYVLNWWEADVYSGCTIYAWNVTVYGILRLLGGSTLIVGKPYPLGPPWPYPVPNPFPVMPRHSVHVEDGGLFEILDSRMTARVATWGFGFEAKAGSAFHANRSAAFYPWGQWSLPIPGGGAVTTWNGGLVVNTTAFAFRDSTVAYGRLHGMYLAPGLDFGTLSGDTFRDNHAAGLFVDADAAVNASSSAFSGNRFGVFAMGSSPRLEGDAIVGNRYGVKVEGPSSAVLTNSTVTHNALVGAWFGNTSARSPRVTWDAGFGWNRFSAYALSSSLHVDNSTFMADDSGLVFDRSPSALFESSVAHAHNYTLTVANGSSARIAGASTIGIAYLQTYERAPNTTYYFTALSCSGSNCTVEDTHLPSICGGILAESSVIAIVGATVGATGCGDVWGNAVPPWGTWDLALRDSWVSVQDNVLEASGMAMYIERAFGLPVVSGNTIEAGVQVTLSPGTRIEDNNVTAQVTVSSSANLTFLRNNVTSERGLFLIGSLAAQVTDNNFTGTEPWSPTYRPGYGTPPPGYGRSNRTLDAGHIAVYYNSTATILRNRFVRGVWGISLDDREAGGDEHYRNNYARIENNSFDDNGYIAVGVDTTSRADVRANWINRSSGWAIQVESGFPLPSNPGGPGNTVAGNWVNDTYGQTSSWGWDNDSKRWVLTHQACDSTAIQLNWEHANKPGRAEVWDNHVLRTNGTGIRVCYDKAVYVHDNVLDGGGVVQNGTFAGPTEAGIALHASHVGPSVNRVEHNTVGGFQTGLWIKTNTSGWDVDNNTLSGNGDGVLVGWGDAANTYAWADLHDNTFTGNVVGVNVSAANWSPREGPFNATYVGNATLRRNTIADNTYGVYLRVFIKTYNVTIRPLPHVPIQDHNAITGNAYGVYLKGGYLPNGTLYPVWANITGNNTISENGYGVWIDGPTVDPTANHFWLWWNDIRGNTQAQGGVYVNGDPQGHWGNNVFFHAYCNWWNSTGGPYDPPPDTPDTNENPDLNAQFVSDYFWYREKPPTLPPPLGWLNRTAGDPLTACSGGV